MAQSVIIKIRGQPAIADEIAPDRPDTLIAVPGAEEVGRLIQRIDDPLPGMVRMTVPPLQFRDINGVAKLVDAVKLGTSPWLTNDDRHLRRPPFFGKPAPYSRSGRLRRERRGHTLRGQLAVIPDTRQWGHEMAERGDRRPRLQHLRCLFGGSQRSATWPGTDRGYLLNCAAGPIGNNFFSATRCRARNHPGPTVLIGVPSRRSASSVLRNQRTQSVPDGIPTGTVGTSPSNDSIQSWE